MRVYDLWLPIIASGVATHVMSTLNWMVLPQHKSEWRKLPVEDEIQNLIASNNVQPEQYMIPFTQDGKECQSEAFKAKQAKCTGMLILWDKPLNMGVAIGQTLAFFLIAAFVIGYLASIALPVGATFMVVFKFVTTAGLLAHCFAKFPYVFWFRRKVLFDVLDGVGFAIVTGLIFAWLWPMT